MTATAFPSLTETQLGRLHALGIDPEVSHERFLADVTGRSPERVLELIRDAAESCELPLPAALPAAAAPALPADGVLTGAQQLVIGLVARGLTNVEVAEVLSLSVETVKRHMRAIIGRLGARNRVDAALIAIASEQAAGFGEGPAG